MTQQYPVSASRPRVILSGMMGSGKSTVGRILADCLGWEFVDTDEILAARLGKSVRDIFAQEGEAYFRDQEQKLASELQQRQQVVIATGGGMLIPAANRQMLMEDALVVHLRTSVEELVKRLSTTQDRPLLLGQDLRSGLESIYRSRASVYEDLPLQIDTDEHSPMSVTQEILFHLLRSHHTIQAGEHQVHVGFNLISRLDSFLQASRAASPLVLVADADFWRLSSGYWRRELERQTNGRYEVVPVLLPSHEKSKSIQTAVRLWQKLIAAGAQRNSAVIVVGGGVLGDVGGFAASTFMRGVRLIQTPTTLLAQIDSSLGGKTGVNLNQTKNMIGTFYPAHHTLLDPLLLLTLPEREMRSGMAEMIKAAMIADAQFFEFLESQMASLLSWRLQPLLHAIEWAAKIKLAIVQEDLYERSGKRMLLNFGHTLGHALEAGSRYALRHGEAVAIGMVLATRLAVRRGKCSAETLTRLQQLLQRAQLPVEPPPVSPKLLLAKVQRDKKRAHRHLNYVIPTAIGAAEILPITALHDLLTAFGE